MKKISYLLVILFVSFSTYAQDSVNNSSERQKEIGISFSDLNSFGLSYKIGKSDVAWRFQGILLSGQNQEQDYENLTKNVSSKGFDLRAGREYRKILTNKIEFRYGLDLLYGYGKHTRKEETKGLSPVVNEDITQKYHKIGASIVLGINYKVAENLYIGAEILPGINYTKRNDEAEASNISAGGKTESKIFSYGLSSNSARINLSFRF